MKKYCRKKSVLALLSSYSTIVYVGIVIAVYVFQVCLGLTKFYSILFLPVYFVVAYLLMCTSYVILCKDGWKRLMKIDKFLRFIFEKQGVTRHYLGVSVVEEFIWRFIPVSIIMFADLSVFSAYIFLIIGIVFFTAIHFIHLREIYLFNVYEFFVFFSLLTIVYYYWTDFVFIVVLHFVRNMIIMFLRYEKAEYTPKKFIN